MLRHMGWTEAADLIIHGLDKSIGKKHVTYVSFCFLLLFEIILILIII